MQQIKIPLELVLTKIENWKEMSSFVNFYGYNGYDFDCLYVQNGKLYSETARSAGDKECTKDSSNYVSFWDIQTNEEITYDDTEFTFNGELLTTIRKLIESADQNLKVASNRHKVSLLYHNSVAPRRARPEETGYDLTIQRYEIDEKNPEKICFFFGVSIEPAEGYDFRIYPRSSIHKTAFRMCNSIGLIDAPFRGELRAFCDIEKLHLFVESGWNPRLYFDSFIGKSLFQLVENKLEIHTGFDIVSEEDLSETTRGSGGFGSTDTHGK